MNKQRWMMVTYEKMNRSALLLEMRRKTIKKRS